MKHSDIAAQFGQLFPLQIRQEVASCTSCRRVDFPGVFCGVIRFFVLGRIVERVTYRDR